MAAEGLYVWGGGSLRDARARAAAGATVVAWPGCDRGALAREGLHARDLDEVLSPEDRSAVAAAERGFARVWARVPLAEGRSFRDLVEWRGESLLFVAESFVLRATAGPRCAGIAETCLRLLDATGPGEVDAAGLPPHEMLLLARAATVRGVLFHGDESRSVKPLSPAPAGDEGGRRGLLDRLALATPRLPAGAAILAIHDAATRPLTQALLDRARAEGISSAAVPTDALPGHETARARRASTEAERALRGTFERLRGTPGLLSSYVHRGVGFAELAGRDLEAILLDHLPRAVRVLERAVDVIAAAHPALVVVAVGGRDRRRALGLAAQAAGAPWAALSATADAEDRLDGGPQPAARLVPADDGGLDDALARLAASVRGSVGPA